MTKNTNVPASPDQSAANDHPHAPLKAWNIPVSRVSDGALEFERHATADQCSALATTLKLQGLRDLRLDGKLAPNPTHPGDFDVRAILTAQINQICSVTLEPMTTALHETLDCRLSRKPPAAATSSEDAELSVLDMEDIEPLENGLAPLARLAYETLVAGIEPFPRKTNSTDGDDGVWTTGQLSGQPEHSDKPFAALAKLKQQTKRGD